MRCTLRLLVFVAITGTVGTGGTITDPFHQAQENCNLNMGPSFSTCDVMGDPMKFDVEKAEVQVTGTTINVTVFFNYGGGAGLNWFNDGVPLQVGDLFFFDPANPQYRYGVPFTNHDGLTAGNLYSISNAGALQTADSLIHNSGYYYRRTEPVWMPAGQTLASTGSGVDVTLNGDGVNQALYAASVSFATPSGFLSLASNGQIGVGFSSAICGNDVLLGAVAVGSGGPQTNVPEPRSLGLFGVGLALIGIGVIRRQRVGSKA